MQISVRATKKTVSKTAPIYRSPLSVLKGSVREITMRNNKRLKFVTYVYNRRRIKI